MPRTLMPVHREEREDEEGGGEAERGRTKEQQADVSAGQRRKNGKTVEEEVETGDTAGRGNASGKKCRKRATQRLAQRRK